MARPNQDAIETFMSITGASEPGALQKLQMDRRPIPLSLLSQSRDHTSGSRAKIPEAQSTQSSSASSGKWVIEFPDPPLVRMPRRGVSECSLVPVQVEAATSRARICLQVVKVTGLNPGSLSFGSGIGPFRWEALVFGTHALLDP
ncbi:hypothetical protein HHK36_027793 [Tetracentron sinense]|uniref:Uncharacterized protein n=1 Tax=Tetracentron sinense TaxID=13715 RepID=A0A834YIP1_TETSI|nr:hypothetical protein HHK36_027793 [Tetracentron sinense]